MYMSKITPNNGIIEEVKRDKRKKRKKWWKFTCAKMATYVAPKGSILTSWVGAKDQSVSLVKKIIKKCVKLFSFFKARSNRLYGSSSNKQPTLFWFTVVAATSLSK